MYGVMPPAALTVVVALSVPGLLRDAVSAAGETEACRAAAAHSDTGTSLVPTRALASVAVTR